MCDKIRRSENAKRRVDVICSKCGVKSDTSHDHWRKNKNGPFYCKSCAQGIRVGAMNKAVRSEEHLAKLRERLATNHPMHNLSEERKDEWKKKLSESHRKNNNEKFTEDQLRIFGSYNNWANMTQLERANFPVDVKCEECGADFETSYGYYTSNQRKSDVWRCPACRYARQGLLMKEVDTFKHKEGSPYYREWYDSLTGKEKADLFNNRKYLDGFSGLNKQFDECFRKAGLDDEYYIDHEVSLYNGRLAYIWDCLIYRKSDNQLVMAVDLDGTFYHGDGSEYQLVVNPNQAERDQIRLLTVPAGVKYCIIPQKDFDE